MPHKVCAFLGQEDKINHLAKELNSEYILLPQGLSMIFLTKELFDRLLESKKIPIHQTMLDIENFNKFSYLAPHIISVLIQHSNKCKLSYFETCYHGGMGWQVAVLFENSQPKFPAFYTVDGEGFHEEDENTSEPVDERAINRVLKEFGVNKIQGMDAFDSMGLGNYRWSE